MNSLIDFYFGLLIFVGYALPFLSVAWLAEIWWTGLPCHKRRRITRKLEKLL